MEKISFENKLVLAPLAGYTDRPFREIAISFGADIVYTEMVSSAGLANEDKKTQRLIDISPYEAKEALVGVQIFGRDQESLKYATHKLNLNPQVDIIDLNLGCPAPKVVKNGSGSALLKDPDRVYKILSTMVRTSTKPITAKMRLGIDGSNNYLDLSQAIEEAGVQALAVHGRTKEQMYEGQADWDKIKEIKDHVSIPLIGNGDINSAQVALERLGQVDSIMIGRGAIGRPWIFKEIRDLQAKGYAHDLSLKDKFDTIIGHVESAVEVNGERLAIMEMRKQVHAYLKGMRNSAKIKNQVNTITNEKDLILELETYRDYLLTL